MGALKYIPAPEDQKWLLECIAVLIRQCGYAQLVSQPIVEPTPRFFPEPRGDTLYVLDRTSRRLMQYAGLGDLGLDFEYFSQREVQRGGRRKPDRCVSTLGMFLGLDGGRCHFAINEQQSSDAEHLVGVMSHEVAHAYRVHHGLSVPKRDEEELLTDVTTVYLGFGILSTNNSFRYRSSLEIHSGRTRTSMSTSSAGYLPPQAFSFLLAVQLAARQTSFWRRRAVLRHLEPDQAAFTRAALRHLRENRTLLDDALRIPPPDQRSLPLQIEDILRPLPAYRRPEPR